MTSRNTLGLCIRTKCRTIDELVAWFHRFCDEKSVFIATPTPRPKGFATSFSLELANGEPAFAGEGIVIAAWSTRDNRFRQPGMQIEVCSLSAASARVHEQLLVARAVALDSAQSRELAHGAWEEGTEVSAPMFDDAAAAQPRAAAVANASVGKHTMLGIPSMRLPATPAAPATATPTSASASSSKLGPNAFTFSAPAQIKPPAGRLPGVAAFQPKPDPEPDVLPMPPAPALAKSSSPELAPPAARTEESVSTRVPRLATELGSGPVARAPARVVESVSYDQDVPIDDEPAVPATPSASSNVGDELTVAQAAMPLPMERPMIARDAVGSLHNDFVQGPGNTMHTRAASVAQVAATSESPRPRRRRSLAVVIGALALAGAAVVGVVMMSGSADEQAPAAAKPVAAIAPAAEPRVAAVEEPAAEQAVPEQPAAEEPAAEQPAVEQPAVEQPAVAKSSAKPAKTESVAKPVPAKRTATKAAKRTSVKRVAAKPSPVPTKNRGKKKTCASLDCL